MKKPNQHQNVKRLVFIVFLILFSMPLIKAQNLEIRGRVINATSNEPISGATVVVKGTNTGTLTDLNGNFSLSVSPGSTLVVSFIGMTKQEIAITGGGFQNISLQEEVMGLDEVVVTGYSSQRKVDLTGAVTVVKVADIAKTSSGNVLKSLQGRVPNLNITVSGNPSEAVNVNIRGQSTFGNNDPLYIVDGMPFTSNLNQLDQNDIESIQVLKDASSATIYGARASNGVIIITTRKARRGEVKLEYDAYVSLSKWTDPYPILNTEEWGRMYWQTAINSGTVTPTHALYTYEMHRDASGNAILDKVTPNEYIDAAHTMKSADTDWQKEVYQTALKQYHNLTMSSGTEKSRVLFSLDYSDADGIIKTTNYNKITARINSDYLLLKDKLSVGENLSFSNIAEITDWNGAAGLSYIAMPIIPVHTVDGEGWGGPATGMSDRQNPVRMLEDYKQNVGKTVRIAGNLFADLEIIKNLHLKTNFGINDGSWRRRQMYYKYVSGFLADSKNYVTNETSYGKDIVWSNTLTYNISSDDHRADILLGTEMIKNMSENFWARRENFASESEDYMYLNTGTANKDNDGLASENRLLSYFGKVNYIFKEKYLASAIVRRDGSSRFGVDKRFGIFPAFSLGWRISEEAFLQSIKPFLTDFKIRGGWGVTGNQEIGNYASYELWVSDYGTNGTGINGIYTGTAYDISGANTGNLQSGFRMDQRGNANLKWEEAQQTNIGFDFSIMENKISGSFDYFVKNTSDILIKPPVLSAFGEGASGSQRYVNGASWSNKGYEIIINYNGNLANGLSYSISANAAHYRNEVTKLPKEVINAYGGNGVDDNILGRPYSSLYGYVTEGIFKTAEEVADYKSVQPTAAIGRLKYKDLNGDGKLNDTYDRTWLGVQIPTLTYGFSADLAFKGFDFSFFWQGIAGNKLNNAHKARTDSYSWADPGTNRGKRTLEAWTPDNPDSSIPMLTFTDTNRESRFSDYYVESGAYLKLRNAQLGYTLPSSVVGKIRMEKIRVYLSGQNLITFKQTKGKYAVTGGVDPEQLDQFSPFPIPIVGTFGINVTF